MTSDLLIPSTSGPSARGGTDERDTARDTNSPATARSDDTFHSCRSSSPENEGHGSSRRFDSETAPTSLDPADAMAFDHTALLFALLQQQPPTSPTFDSSKVVSWRDDVALSTEAQAQEPSPPPYVPTSGVSDDDEKPVLTVSVPNSTTALAGSADNRGDLTGFSELDGRHELNDIPIDPWLLNLTSKEKDCDPPPGESSWVQSIFASGLGSLMKSIRREPAYSTDDHSARPTSPISTGSIDQATEIADTVVPQVISGPSLIARTREGTSAILRNADRYFWKPPRDRVAKWGNSKFDSYVFDTVNNTVKSAFRTATHPKSWFRGESGWVGSTVKRSVKRTVTGYAREGWRRKPDWLIPTATAVGSLASAGVGFAIARHLYGNESGGHVGNDAKTALESVGRLAGTGKAALSIFGVGGRGSSRGDDHDVF